MSQAPCGHCLVVWPRAVAVGHSALALTFEHRMDGHQSTAVIQAQLRGEPMDLDDPPRERVGHRVLVALDADHPIARQAPLHAQHGRVRVRRQRLQLPTFLREGFLDHPPRRAVLTPVGNLYPPAVELGVQMPQVVELAGEEVATWT